MENKENLYKSYSYKNTAENLSLREEEADLIGRKITKSLDLSLETTPFHVNQRLSKARALAISKKKPEKQLAWASQMSLAGHPSAKTRNSKSFVRNMGWLAPAILLIVGLVLITQWQQDARINDIADLDTAILSDEVPPDAYADNGFWVFLKQITNQSDENSDTSNELSK